MLSATRGSQFTQSLMLFVRPSYVLRYTPRLFPHTALVTDSGWHALHTTLDPFLGIYSPAGAVSRHRKCAPSAGHSR